VLFLFNNLLPIIIISFLKKYNIKNVFLMKVLCREKNIKSLSIIQVYLQKNCLRFCADYINLKDWLPLLNSIMKDRSLSEIYVYSQCRNKKIREKMDTEEKLMKLW